MHAEVRELLEALFAERVVPDAEPAPNVIVDLAERRETGNQPLHTVALHGRRCLRTRSVRRVMDALWHLLDAFGQVESSRCPQLDASVLVTDGRAHVFEPSRRRGMADHDRGWRRDGFQLVDRHTVTLDPVAATVTIPGSRLAWPDGIAARLAELALCDVAEAVPPVGVLPIASWTFEDVGSGPTDRLVRAAAQVRNRRAVSGRMLLESLRALLDAVPSAAGITDHAELRHWMEGRCL